MKLIPFTGLVKQEYYKLYSLAEGPDKDYYKTLCSYSVIFNDLLVEFMDEDLDNDEV